MMRTLFTQQGKPSLAVIVLDVKEKLKIKKPWHAHMWMYLHRKFIVIEKMGNQNEVNPVQAKR